MNGKTEKLKDIISGSSRIVFFGGAGVSTESGVKDYRSSDGLYNTVREYGVSPETILSRTFFFGNTQTFYDFYYKYFLDCEAQPNRAHRALALLEERGKLSSVITQNIDGLHQKAGSKNVLELHGTVAENFCTHCGKNFDMQYLKNLKGQIPYCDSCGGLIKPKVVLYEEALDEDVTGRAVREISKADTLIIGGTSLAVYPAASYVRYFNGNNLVLINREPTPYDSYADVVINDSIGDVLSAVV